MKFRIGIVGILLLLLAQSTPGSADQNQRYLSAAFGYERSSDEDIVIFYDREMMKGRVLTEKISIRTPYGLIRVPLRHCAGVSFEASAVNQEILLTYNFNRFSGIVVDSFVRFQAGGRSKPINIHKEKIRYLILKKTPVEDRLISSPQKSDLFIMSNGDMLTGKAANATLTLQAGNTELLLDFSKIQSVDIVEPSRFTTRIKKKGGELVQGILQTNDIHLTLDTGDGISTLYKGNISKIFTDAGPLQVKSYFSTYPATIFRAQAAIRYHEYISSPIGIKFKLIHPGTFMMGSDSRWFDEKPIHKVNISKPFYISIFEITQAQWGKMMPYNPSRFKGLKHPVENLTWNEIQEFCRKLSEREGVIYRLPTEAEWEFACRAGTTTKYYWGDDFNGNYAWIWFNSEGETHPVGLKMPNPWGLYDMVGNVGEWCQDAYAPYVSKEQTDPQNTSGATRVLRGCSWDSHPEICHSSERLHLGPEEKSDSFGFRLVREK